MKTNSEISRLFRSVAAALQLKRGDNRFRVSAYERAADSIDHASSDLKDLWDDKRLGELPGIGENMAEHLDELFRTGKVKHFEKILQPFPPAMFELMEVPGIGPKGAYRLCKALGISKAHNALSMLEKAAKKDHIAKIAGFGKDSQAEILRGIAEYKNRSDRLLLSDAAQIVDDLIAWLKTNPDVIQVHPLGSFRRKAATVGDIDLSVSTLSPTSVINHFGAYPQKVRLLEAGDTSSSIILPRGIQVDLMTTKPESYGSLLQHFTGSKLHNIALRELAIKKGYSLSEYGIKTKSKLEKFSSEVDFYRFLGLEFIPPELRENTGEIAAAQSDQLPNLIELSQIKGDLHVHSSINVEPGHDLGTSSLEQLTSVARDLGYEYLGVSEHNPSASGHTPDQILNIIKMKTNIVHQYNQYHEKESENNIYIFNGLEIDILPNGTRSLPDACLDLLDYASVSIHTAFRQSRKIMTDRVILALNHPKVRFLAHPSARILKEREGIDLDWDRIFDFCLKENKWLEINAWPNRLDLSDLQVRDFVNLGGKMIINSDSHAASQLSNLRYGVSVARRGWASASCIINTLPLAKFVKILKKEVI